MSQSSDTALQEVVFGRAQFKVGGSSISVVMRGFADYEERGFPAGVWEVAREVHRHLSPRLMTRFPAVTRDSHSNPRMVRIAGSRLVHVRSRAVAGAQSASLQVAVSLIIHANYHDQSRAIVETFLRNLVEVLAREGAIVTKCDEIEIQDPYTPSR